MTKARLPLLRGLVALAATSVSWPQEAPEPPLGAGLSSASGVVTGPGTVLSETRIGAESGIPTGTLNRSDEFGSAVCVVGDVDGNGVADLAVGAARDSDGGTGSGAVWILFLERDHTIRAYQEINARRGGFTGDIDDRDSFGTAVAPVGDLDGNGVPDLLVGAPTTSQGDVWLLRLQSDGTVLGNDLINAGTTGLPIEDVEFGHGIAALGDLDGDGTLEVAIGAPGTRHEGFTHSGAFWIMSMRTDGSIAAAREIDPFDEGFAGNLGNGEFGLSLAAVGDVDGDGVQDLLVGAPLTNDGGFHRGAAWLLFLDRDGTVRGTRRFPFQDAPEEADYDHFGRSVLGVGDLNDDGVPDIAIGAPFDNRSGLSNCGSLWVYFLNADGSVAARQQVSAGIGGFQGALDVNDSMGSSLCVQREVENGSVEILTGATADADGGLRHGALWDIRLGADGTALSWEKISCLRPDFRDTIDGEDRFGVSLAWIDDLDGNGHRELAVGAVGDSDLALSAGAVWIVFFDPSGTVMSLVKINDFEGGFSGTLGPFASWGYRLVTLEDLDHDGRREIAVGVARPENVAVWILFLNADGTVRRHARIDPSDPAFGGDLGQNDSFGSTFANLGDLDLDGVGDLAVGAPKDGDGGSNSGAIWILFLREDGSVKATQKISATQGGFRGELGYGSRLGLWLASMAFDGDGVPDLVTANWIAGSNNGEMWILSLRRDGTVASHREIPPSQTTQHANWLSTIDDLDGDGLPELLVGDSRFALLSVFFIDRDANVRRIVQFGSGEGGFGGEIGQFASFCESIESPGDLDGDGVVDLAIGAPGPNSLAEPSDGGGVWLVRLDGFVTLDFDVEDDRWTPLQNGQDVTVEDEFGRVVTVSGRPASGLTAAIFDSSFEGPNQFGDSAELLVGRGNVLILQAEEGQSTPGFYDRPRSDARGGTFAVDFDAPITPRSVDLLAIGPGPERRANVTLVDDAGRQRRYKVPGGWTENLFIEGPPGFRTLDLTTLLPQPGFQATATAAEMPGFDPSSVVKLRVELGGAGAIDNVVYDPHPDTATTTPQGTGGRRSMDGAR